jgi:hypothetical protein
MPYCDVEVTFIKSLPSGKAFVVEHEGEEVIVPDFAVHSDSEIHVNLVQRETGTLIIQERIAIEKGLAGQKLGGGLPMKRNKMPELPELLSKTRLDSITARVRCTSAFQHGGWVQSEDGDSVTYQDEDGDTHYIGCFNEEADTDFAAQAPDDIQALLDENERLRAWMDLAVERFNARRRTKR